jgi:signal transduction histidine kinase/integral membrane sensor domain MASE1
VEKEAVMQDFQLVVSRLRNMLDSSERRARSSVLRHPSTWPAQLDSLHTREGWQALWHQSLPILAFAAAYLAAYVYGNGLPSPAPLWPPDAILLSALLLASPRRWWIYLLITIPIRMIPAFAPGVPTWLLIVNLLNDMLMALIAAVLVRRYASYPLSFTTLRAMGIYLACAVLVAPILSAFVGAACLVTLGTPYWQAWITWFLGDALASLVLTPTIVMWVTTGRIGLHPASRARAAEALLLAAALLVMGMLLLFTQVPLVMDDALFYLPIPLLVWAAVRFGPRGIASALTVVTCFAIVSVAGFWGVVTSTSTPRAVLALQLFLIATAVPLLLLAAQIEERKQAVEKVERHAEQLDRIFEAVADGIAVYDLDGREIRTNAALQCLFQLDIAHPEFAQMSLHERMALLAPRDEQGRHLALDELPLPRALAGEVMAGTKAMDLRSRTLGGRELELNVSAAPLHDSAGQLVGVVCVFRDQTERKRLEREREEARAGEMALREVNQQLDTFVAVAAHDLRQPVTAAKLVIAQAQRRVQQAVAKAHQDISKQMVPFAPVKTALDATQRNLDRLLQLVQQLLDVTRARQGILTQSLQPCRLEVLVNTVVEEQRLLTPRRTLLLDLPEAGRLSIMVNADAERLSQVLTNYLANAVRYSPDDQTIEVSLRLVKQAPEDGKETMARVAVRDHGPGIAPEERSTIWDRFQRAHRTSEARGGLGLGLYIARTIIERHGGHVGVESTLGEGATFWFTLPLAPLEAGSAES